MVAAGRSPGSGVPDRQDVLNSYQQWQKILICRLANIRSCMKFSDAP